MAYKGSRFVFIIPLKGRALSKNFDHVLQLLRGTVESLLAQSEPNFRAVIACQDQPDIGMPYDERFEWLRIEQPPDPTAYHGDKPMKLAALGHHLRDGGADDVYSMMLDGDDLVHRDFVKYALEDDNHRGYVMYTGYNYNYPTARLTVMNRPEWLFFHLCGSSCAAHLKARDLQSKKANEPTYFDQVTRQSFCEVYAQRTGRPLKVVPFPAVVYRMNHDESLQFRKKGPKNHPGELIAPEDAAVILDRDFAWPEGAALARAASPEPPKTLRRQRQAS